MLGVLESHRRIQEYRRGDARHGRRYNGYRLVPGSVDLDALAGKLGIVQRGIWTDCMPGHIVIFAKSLFPKGHLVQPEIFFLFGDGVQLHRRQKRFVTVLKGFIGHIHSFITLGYIARAYGLVAGNGNVLTGLVNLLHIGKVF
ncbi:hypothetical protein SDC9_140728 [bioreactor metagenome]|uniref:Uncharacterized protein n=1 Tax=bioreactor metagenome TaxID=1076179 RepID=A0A645DWT7_9ZZZZ